MAGNKPASASKGSSSTKKNAPPPPGQRSVLAFFQKVTPAKPAAQATPEEPDNEAAPAPAPAAPPAELEPSPAPPGEPSGAGAGAGSAPVTAIKGTAKPTTTPAKAKAPEKEEAKGKEPAPKKKAAGKTPAKTKEPVKAQDVAKAPPADAMEDDEEEGMVIKGRPGRAAAKRARAKARVVTSDSEEEEEEEEDPSDDEMSVSEYAGESEEEDSEEESAEESDDDEEEEDSEDDSPKKRGRGKGKAPSKKAQPARKKARIEDEDEDEEGKGQAAGSMKTPGAGIKTADGAGGATAFKTPATAVRLSPQTGAKASLHRSLGVSTPPSTARKASPAEDRATIVMGNRTGELLGDAARFAERDADKFPFLRPDRITDAEGRRPDHPQYDPRTFRIPKDWFKTAKISDGQQQWWEFKSRHFDSVLLFKMGKFYEMFNMDAHVGVEVLGLQYMKGEQAHAGFPEANYHSHAERLARAGFKVAVIEQTETPDQLKVRNEELKRRGQKMAKVVNRELVAVLTQGTLYDPEMLQASPDASWLLALHEAPVMDPCAAPGSVELAACACDVTTGEFLLGMWRDDELRPQLRAQLAALQPVEVIHMAAKAEGELSALTMKVLKGSLAGRRFNVVRPAVQGSVIGTLEGRGYFAAAEGAQELEEGGEMGVREPFPELLRELQAKDLSPCLNAYFMAVEYLRESLLDKAVVPLGRLGLLTIATEDAEKLAQLAAKVTSSANPTLAEDPFAHVPYCRIDGSALESLEVLENSEGGGQGTLVAAVDRTATPGGRRLLRSWLSRPLVRPVDIVARQEAVRDLGDGCEEAAQEARKELHGLPDLERSLARLHASVAGGGTGRDAANVVLYEDAAKKRVQNLLAALKGLRAVAKAAECFRAPIKAGLLKSRLLRMLVDPALGVFPDMEQKLEQTEKAANWDKAASTGRVQPGRGVDPEYDAALDAEAESDRAMAAYLKESRQTLGGSQSIEWVTKGSMTFLEVPESLEKRVPDDWELMDTRKGFKRYSNDEIRELVEAQKAAQVAKEKATGSILANIVSAFVKHRATWQRAVDCMNQLDALTALAQAASLWEGPSCMPTFVPEDQPSVLRARSLRHPAGLSGGRAFVPNDVSLGGAQPPFLVLTGPNMGGKSTLLRQVCLATLLAQVGGKVPAAQLELTPVDAIFVRMGAKDRIMAGQSTFFVELSEAAAVLQNATSRSLVACDELGRGTATTDGCAIAAAVLHHLSNVTKCRGLFATHYHHLVRDHELVGATGDAPHVSMWHMACAVKAGEEPGKPEDVTFLYKLRQGACPRSYGVNVAKLAGLPDSVVRRAYQKASELETGASGQGGQEGGDHAEDEAGICLALRALAQLKEEKLSDDEAFARLLKMHAALAKAEDMRME